MSGVGGGEHCLALLVQRWRQAGVDRRRRHEAEGGVVLLVAVPVEEWLRPGAGIEQVAEAARERRMVFDRLERRFGEGDVIWDPWPGQAGGYAHIDQQ
jgi:hypothetical protein